MAAGEPASKIRFSCSSCGAVFSVAPELAGRRAVCKNCRAKLVVPAPSAPAPAPQAAAAPSSAPAARAGSRRRWRPGRLWLLLLLAIAVGGLAAAGSWYSSYAKGVQKKSGLARTAALNEEAVAALLSDAAADWESAAERTTGWIVELENLSPGDASRQHSALLDFLRRQEVFMRTKIRLDQLGESAAASLADYRRHIWHPPAEPHQWALYLEQAEHFHRQLRPLLDTLGEAAAAALERHSELVEAETTAAARLAAGGIRMATHFSDTAERLQAELAEAGRRASRETLD